MMNASVQEKFQIEQASDKTFAPVRQFEIRNNITVQESRIQKIHDLSFRQRVARHVAVDARSPATRMLMDVEQDVRGLGVG